MAMTAKEHELMILLFARIKQQHGMLLEILKSRGIVTGDDPKAFGHMVFDDPTKLLQYAAAAHIEYLQMMAQEGLAMPQDSQPGEE